jgi:putative chitinase
MNLTAEQISKASGSSLENAERFRPYLNKYMDKYGVNTPNRVLAFLSQIGHESGGLKHTLEQGNLSINYEGNKDLGNIYAGDGVKYKGRGLIQLTGRANYQKMSEKTGKDLINNPQLVEQPDLATEVRVIWWKDRKRSGLTLNEWADRYDPKQPIDSANNKDILENITRAINGGINGWEDRLRRMSNGLSIFDEIKKKISSFGTSFANNKNKWLIVSSAILIFGSTIVFSIWYLKKRKAI